MKLLLLVFLLLGFGAKAQPAGPLLIQQPRTSPLLRSKLVVYYPALALRIGMEGVAWVRCTAIADGTVSTVALDHLDSLTVQEINTKELARFSEPAKADLIAEALKRVRQIQFVPAAERQYLVPVRYHIGGHLQQESPRVPIR